MGEFTITRHDGSQFDVTAETPEEASQKVEKYVRQQISEQGQKDFNEAPWYKKAGIAADDTMRIMADTGTFGMLDRLMGGDEAHKTAAARDRAGLAGTAADVATAAAMIPSAVPTAVAKMGGGPLARWLTGTTVAGIEGGAYGGAQAAGHGEDPVQGAAIGTVGGAGGHQVAGILGKGADKLAGIDNSVPQGIRSKMTVLPPKGASPADKVTVAINEAKSKARVSDDPLAFQSGVRKNVESILRTDKKSFTPEQQALMGKLVDEDPATKIGRGVGNFLSDRVSLMAGAGGAGALFGGIPVAGALALPAATMAGAKAARAASMGGTKEAADDLLRAMYKKKKINSILSTGDQADIQKGVRQFLLDEAGAEDY